MWNLKRWCLHTGKRIPPSKSKRFKGMPGKKIYGLWLQICLLWAVPGMALSQDVIISVPASHIFNRTELNTSEVVMNTNGFNRWRTLLGLLNLIIGAEDPKIQAQVNSFQIVSGT